MKLDPFLSNPDKPGMFHPPLKVLFALGIEVRGPPGIFYRRLAGFAQPFVTL
jgi:hypothetical protein